MEWLEWIGPVLMAALVISAALQLIWSHALSAIARKQEQSELLQLLAWVPVLQIAPMLIAGGGTVPGFLLGLLGLVLGCVVLGAASAFIGGGIGSAIGTLCVLFVLVISVGYFGRIAWTTAVRRDLPGWIGLLVFVPIANLFVYPYLAFHDGWVAPHKIGLAIGLVLAFGSTAPSFRALQMLQAQGGLPPELAALASLADEGDFAALLEAQGGPPGAQGATGAAPTSGPGSAELAPEASIRALYALQGRFEILARETSPAALRRPDAGRRAMDLLRSIRAELEAQRGALDDRTYRELAEHLIEVEGRLIETPGEAPAPSRFSARETGSSSSWPPSGAAFPAAMAAADASAPTTPPTRPIPVQPGESCPPGTELRNRSSEKGEEEWCQQRDADGGLRHGWYARYGEGGRPESMGEYANGLRVGVWTRFHDSGQVRAQVEFVDGLQHGWLLSFDDEGRRTRAVRFDRGAPVR